MQLANGITVDGAAMSADTGILESTIEEILDKVHQDRFMKKMTLAEELGGAKSYDQIMSVYLRIGRFAPEDTSLFKQAHEKMVAVSLVDLANAKTRNEIYAIHSRNYVAEDPQLKLETFIRLAEFFIVIEK